MQNCQDAYSDTFGSYAELFGYQQQLSDRSTWTRCAVNQLHVKPLEKNSLSFPSLTDFASGVSVEAVEDTINNLGLAIQFDRKLYPVRETARGSFAPTVRTYESMPSESTLPPLVSSVTRYTRS